MQLTANEIGAILSTLFGGQGWDISKPRDGWQKETFLAQRGDRRLFIKFDVNPQALKRLGEIKVAPPLLSSGTHKGRRYSIQQYVAGVYPSRQWLQQHLKTLGRLFARYHRDQNLLLLLPKPPSKSYRDLLAKEVQILRERLPKDGSDLFSSQTVRQAFAEFEVQAGHLREASLVPTHGDPSRKNFLLLDEQLFMIDWDELILSDAMRDTGPFLWWYASPDTWPEFFDSYAEDLDKPQLDRLYWWAARQSLQVALWTANEAGAHKETQAFLEDFEAGVAQQDNPHLSNGG
jgi:thiamine kinase-like enzyme